MESIDQNIHEKTCRERLTWLVQLRWIAGIMAFSVISISLSVFHLPLPAFPLYLGNAFLFIYNGILVIMLQRLARSVHETDRYRRVQTFANLQISIDLILLSYFIHFSGGLENPFIFYFIFHMVISGILLSAGAAYFQASLAVILLTAIGAAELTHVTTHIHLSGFLNAQTCRLSLPYTAGLLFIVSSTLFLTVYMTTSIEQRLRQRETELASANRLLAEQDRLKSQYVLTVSHDLQSSLATIQSCLYVVLNNLTGELPEKAREMIGRAAQRADHLNHFVRDLLNLSRIRAMKDLEKTPVKLGMLAEKQAELWKMQIKEKALSVTIQIPEHLTVSGNCEALEEMLSNLVGNAIRYTPQNGKIRMKAAEANQTGFICFSISDTGIGIDPEEIPHIFKDFYRARNAEIMEKNGTGLGLSIVKQIVDAHGGSVWLDSDPGKGSIFYIKLPQN